MNFLSRLISKRVRELEEQIACDKMYEAALIARVCEAELKLKARESTPFAKTVAEITRPHRPGEPVIFEPKPKGDVFEQLKAKGYAIAEGVMAKGDLIWREDAIEALQAEPYPVNYTYEGTTLIPRPEAIGRIASLPAAESHEVLSGNATGIAREIIAYQKQNTEFVKEMVGDKSLIADLRERIRLKDEKIKELTIHLHPLASSAHDVEFYYREAEQTGDYAAAYHALLTAKEQGQKKHASEIEVMEAATEALKKANARIAELESGTQCASEEKPDCSIDLLAEYVTFAKRVTFVNKIVFGRNAKYIYDDILKLMNGTAEFLKIEMVFDERENSIGLECEPDISTWNTGFFGKPYTMSLAIQEGKERIAELQEQLAAREQALENALKKEES